MPFCAFVVFAAFELEDDDLRAAAIFEHGCGDARSGDRWRADADAVRVAGDQDLVEFDPVPLILIGQSGDANDVSGTHTELFSACAYDCVRHFLCRLQFLFTYKAADYRRQCEKVSTWSCGWPFMDCNKFCNCCALGRSLALSRETSGAGVSVFRKGAKALSSQRLLREAHPGLSSR